MTASPSITAVVPYFGSDRMIAKHVGTALKGRRWVGIPFAGGMSAVLEIDALSIVVNDLHRHVVNLAYCIADPHIRIELLRRASRKPFHPDVLAMAQGYCEEHRNPSLGDIEAAVQYFLSQWMGRSGKAGTRDEFKCGLSARWNANGGDSNTRFRSALRSMGFFGRSMRRCNFRVMDAIDFLDECEDSEDVGLYGDPPFPEAGRKYLHNAGETDAQERAWHTRLRDRVARFAYSRVVMRFYEHPLVRELYPEPAWTYCPLVGRKQSNADAPELLLINGPAPVGSTGGLF